MSSLWEIITMTVDTAHNDVRWLIKSSMIHELELGVPCQVISRIEMTVTFAGRLPPGVVSTWLWHGSCARSHVSMWLLSSIDLWWMPEACARNDHWCVHGACVGPWRCHPWLLSSACKHRFNKKRDGNFTPMQRCSQTTTPITVMNAGSVHLTHQWHNKTQTG